MKNLIGQIWRLALITVLGLAGCVIAGLMRYGSDVLDPSHVGFAYVAFGLSGGAIFAFYHVQGLSNTITAAVSISAVQFVASAFMLPLLNSALWSFGVNIPAVAVAFLFERKLSILKRWKFVVVGLVYGAMFVLLTLLVGKLTHVTQMPASVFRENFLDGVLIGLGLGIGVQAAESFIHSTGQQRV